MSGLNILRRAMSLDRHRRSLIVEASFELASAAILLRVLPFKRAIARGSLPLRPIAQECVKVEVKDVIWSVELVARRLPFRMVCIHKGIAAQRMLRRRSVPALLQYGVRHDQLEGLSAHVWVTVDGDAVIGGGEAPRFRRLATYP